MTKVPAKKAVAPATKLPAADLRIDSRGSVMQPIISGQEGDRIRIEGAIDLSGSMLNAEESILRAVNLVGDTATAEALKRFDADDRKSATRTAPATKPLATPPKPVMPVAVVPEPLVAAPLVTPIAPLPSPEASHGASQETPAPAPIAPPPAESPPAAPPASHVAPPPQTLEVPGSTLLTPAPGPLEISGL
jgi:hypothetical protein